MGVAGGLRPDDWSQRGAGLCWCAGCRATHEGWGEHHRHRKYDGGQERLARGKRLFNDQSCGSRSGEGLGNRFCTSKNHRQHDPARADRNRYEPRGWSAFRRHQKSRPAQTVGEGRGGRLHGRICRQSRGKLRYWSGFERRWRISSLVRYVNVQALRIDGSEEITQLLGDWSGGNEGALEKLIPLVQPESHRLAHYYMRRERAGHTLQTTALLNEAYLQLTDKTQPQWQNRTHFMAVAAQLMRRIMVDHARARHALKRGGAAQRGTLDEAALLTETRAPELLALDG